MALTLVTGVPRSGKSLYTVKMIVDFFAAGRAVYSDIDNLNIIGLLPAPDDYRTTPHGSVIIYDEVQMRSIWSRKHRGYNDIIESLQTHGHFGYDIVIITQHPKFLNTDVNAVVGEHYHVARAMNAQMANIWLWRHAQDNPHAKSAKREAETTFLFPFPKHLFPLYKSAHNHSHKKLQIPMKIINAAWMLLLVIIAGVWLFHRSANAGTNKPVSKTQSEIASGSDNALKVSIKKPEKPDDKDRNQSLEQTAQDIENKRVAYVVSSDDGTCFAKNSYGDMVKLEISMCLMYSQHPSMLTHSRLQQVEQEWRRSTVDVQQNIDTKI